MADHKHHNYLQAALEEARTASARGEVPIGAVLVNRMTGEIEASAGNATIEKHDPTAHAEILVIRAICEKLGVQRIPEYDLYVTLEPCPMCAAAISFARIGKLVFGALDPKSGGVLSGPRYYDHPQIHHKPEVVHCDTETCGSILSEFFKARRAVNRQS